MKFQRRRFCLAFGLIGAISANAPAQNSSIIEREVMDALIKETSGQKALDHFDTIEARFSGFSPSRGSENMAEWIAARAREWGLAGVTVEKFPSNGRDYFGAFKTEPWWEGKKAELWLVGPVPEKIASFDDDRAHLARFSRSADLTAALVDVGDGTQSSDYSDQSVAGKLVLASGHPESVHRMAVWEFGAAGVIAYRNRDTVNHPDLIESLQIVPREGPAGEPAAFMISLSYQQGRALAEKLSDGKKLLLRAEVEAENRSQIPPSYYPQVHAVVQGTEPRLPEIWIQAHTNYRNGGGGNNLSGVGVTMDLARSLARLVANGSLPQPRRNIRFTWGAEHMAVMSYFHAYPDRIKNVLAYLALDIVGDNQQQSTLRLYRTPHSRPSFLNDVVQEMFELVAEGNTISVRDGRAGGFESRYRLPVLDPAGSRDPFFHKIEPFWGPSDHEDVLEGSIGLHAVLLNAWPDPYIGTNKDTSDLADATQMKRAAVITGASAWVLASASPADIPALVQNALEKARSRLAASERKAMDQVLSSSAKNASVGLWFALNVVSETHRVEAEAIASLENVGHGGRVLNDAVTLIGSLASAARERIVSQMALHADRAGWGRVTPWVPEVGGISGIVPRRTYSVRGPVNIFRHQYGQDWLKEQLEDPNFLDKLRIARRGRYAWYETLNFVDGELNIGQIRDRLAAEYELVPVDEIHEYLEMLEQAGVVTL